MNHASILVTLGAAIIIAVAGCGGQAPAAASPAASPATAVGSATISNTSASRSATISVAPSDLPAASAILPPATGSADRHADQDLEAQLPTEVSGTPLTRYSVTLAQLLDSGGDRAAIDRFLASIGKTEADGTIAAAFDPTTAQTGGIFAYRVRGADPTTLFAAITSIEQTDLGAKATTQATIGGKHVVVASIGSGANDTTWLYGRGDIVFVVHAADDAHASAILQALG